MINVIANELNFATISAYRRLRPFTSEHRDRYRPYPPPTGGGGGDGCESNRV